MTWIFSDWLVGLPFAKYNFDHINNCDYDACFKLLKKHDF